MFVDVWVTTIFVGSYSHTKSSVLYQSFFHWRHNIASVITCIQWIITTNSVMDGFYLFLQVRYEILPATSFHPKRTLVGICPVVSCMDLGYANGRIRVMVPIPLVLGKHFHEIILHSSFHLFYHTIWLWLQSFGLRYSQNLPHFSHRRREVPIMVIVKFYWDSEMADHL